MLQRLHAEAGMQRLQLTLHEQRGIASALAGRPGKLWRWLWEAVNLRGFAIEWLAAAAAPEAPEAPEAPQAAPPASGTPRAAAPPTPQPPAAWAARVRTGTLTIAEFGTLLNTQPAAGLKAWLTVCTASQWAAGHIVLSNTLKNLAAGAAVYEDGLVGVARVIDRAGIFTIHDPLAERLGNCVLHSILQHQQPDAATPHRVG